MVQIIVSIDSKYNLGTYDVHSSINFLRLNLIFINLQKDGSGWLTHQDPR